MVCALLNKKMCSALQGTFMMRLPTRPTRIELEAVRACSSSFVSLYSRHINYSYCHDSSSINWLVQPKEPSLGTWHSRWAAVHSYSWVNRSSSNATWYWFVRTSPVKWMATISNQIQRWFSKWSSRVPCRLLVTYNIIWKCYTPPLVDICMCSWKAIVVMPVSSSEVATTRTSLA
jgi:hypothetical protein